MYITFYPLINIYDLTDKKSVKKDKKREKEREIRCNEVLCAEKISDCENTLLSYSEHSPNI